MDDRTDRDGELFDVAGPARDQHSLFGAGSDERTEGASEIRQQQSRQPDPREEGSADPPSEPESAGAERCERNDELGRRSGDNHALILDNEGRGATDTPRLQPPTSVAPPLISPPISLDTPLGSFGGYALVLTCAQCGDRSKAMDDLLKSAASSAVRVGDYIPKLRCSICRATPVALGMDCLWIRAYRHDGPPRIDLTWMLPTSETVKT